MAKRKVIDDQRLEEIKEDMCDNYCRFPREYFLEREDPEEGFDLMMSERCANCPLNDL